MLERDRIANDGFEDEDSSWLGFQFLFENVPFRFVAALRVVLAKLRVYWHMLGELSD
jgi:hypothetical protein